MKFPSSSITVAASRCKARSSSSSAAHSWREAETEPVPASRALAEQLARRATRFSLFMTV
jgi:hypothetical protein